MKKKVLKPFDLEKAKASAEVCTRDGRKARIICFDKKGIYPVIALINCKEIEKINSYTPKWHTLIGAESQTDLMLVEYEEEEPQFKPFDKVLVRNNIGSMWKCDIYSHYYHNDNVTEYHCIGDWWIYCIPFEGNEHLLGTTDNPE